MALLHQSNKGNTMTSMDGLPWSSCNESLQEHLHYHLHVCELSLLQISDVAGKESNIEVALDKMAAEWANAEITVLEYRDTGTYVIKLDEAVLQQLDDHIGKPLAAFACPQACIAFHDVLAVLLKALHSSSTAHVSMP